MTPGEEQVKNILMTLPTSDSGNYYHDDLVQAFAVALAQARREALKEAHALTRAEAVAMVNRHCNTMIPNDEIRPRVFLRYDATLKTDGPMPAKKRNFHYGRCELRALMDAIYGGPPDPTKLEEWIQAK